MVKEVGVRGAYSNQSPCSGLQCVGGSLLLRQERECEMSSKGMAISQKGEGR